MSPVPEEEACFSSRFAKAQHSPGPWIRALIPDPGIFFLPKCAPQLGSLLAPKSEKRVF